MESENIKKKEDGPYEKRVSKRIGHGKTESLESSLPKELVVRF